jgi:transposase
MMRKQLLWKDEFLLIMADSQYPQEGSREEERDVKDSEWIASLLRCGLIPASFIPSRPIRELRELYRRRRKSVGIMASEKNRIQKVLEDANIKLASVVSKIDGISSTNMIQALLNKDKLSKTDPKNARDGRRID